MWIAVKTDNWNGTAFVEKDGEVCVDFCRETGIMIPAFERTLDFEDRAEKVQKNLKKVLDKRLEMCYDVKVRWKHWKQLLM